MSLKSILDGIENYCGSRDWVDVKLDNDALKPENLNTDVNPIGCEVGTIIFSHVEPNETYEIDAFDEFRYVRLFLKSGSRCSKPFPIMDEKNVERVMESVKEDLATHPLYKVIKKVS